MHRFLRTCRNKGGTWPAQEEERKKGDAAWSTHGGWERRGGVGRRGREGTLLSALNSYLPRVSHMSLPLSFTSRFILLREARWIIILLGLLCFVLAHLWAYVEKLSEWTRANHFCFNVLPGTSDGSKTRWKSQTNTYIYSELIICN